MSQTPTRNHAAGFGGKTAKTYKPTDINWNDAAANERERVGIVKIRAIYVHDNLNSTHSALHHGYYLCLWEQVMSHFGRHVTDIRHAMTDSRNIPPNA